MHQQKIERGRPKPQPTVYNLKTPKVPELPTLPEAADQPVRAVLYVEVGDMEQARVQLLIQEINKVYDGARGGIHYVIPVRHGKLNSDISFEGEFLALIRSLCTVVNGEIVFKDGAKEMRIVREHIN